MSRLLCWLSLIVLAAGLVLAVVETRDLAEQLGLADVQLRGLRADRDASIAASTAALAELAASRDANAAQRERGTALEQRVRQLEAELQLAVAREQSLLATVDAQRADFERRRAELTAERERRRAPMPEGVRQCLIALHDCLRTDGFGGYRFLSARSLDENGLHEVELLATSPDGLSASVYTAGRMTARLNRATAELVLSFHDGVRTVDGNAEPLPEQGLPVVFRPVDGRLWEERLPYLVVGDGAYPEPAASNTPRPGDLSPVTRAQWIERLDALFTAAGTAQKLRISAVRGLEDARFRAVQLHGYDQKRHLVLSAGVEQMAVEVDERTGVVSLLLQSGTLRQAGGISTISAEGYRMLLPNVTPKQASEIMLGMVVRR